MIRKATSAVILASTLLMPWLARADWLGTDFDASQLTGNYIIEMSGAFASPPPPFTGAPLQLMAAELGRLTLDSSGNAYGEKTLTFHHPDVPFGVRQRIALAGSFVVEADGRTIFALDEFPIAPDGSIAPQRTGSIKYECYIEVRHWRAACIAHTLVSNQQGPQPKALPVTMSGSLQRQR